MLLFSENMIKYTYKKEHIIFKSIYFSLCLESKKRKHRKIYGIMYKSTTYSEFDII